MLNNDISPQPKKSDDIPKNKHYINIQAIYKESLDSYSEFWDENLSLASNIQFLLENTVLVPNGKVQYPIMAAYTMLPTNLCAVLPIAFSYGCRGSGKTTASILAAKIRGVEHIFSPGDTFASSRNLINSMRYYDEDNEYEKPGCIMVWDNLSEEIISASPQLYNVLLAGYNRTSATVRIASKSGENIEFNVFCPKWFSSVSPLHQVSRFNELGRRILLFVHKPLEQFSAIEQSELGITPDELIDIDSVSWDGLGRRFADFWELEANIKEYINVRKSLTRRNSRLIKLPPGFDPAKRSMCIDLIATMLTTEMIDDAQTGIEMLHKHFQWCDEISASSSVILGKIREYINEVLGRQLEANIKLMDAGLEPEPLEIKTTAIHSQMYAWYKDGTIDILPTVKNYRPAFEMLGYVYTGDSFVKK